MAKRTKYLLDIDERGKIHLPQELVDYLDSPGEELVLMGILDHLDLTTVEKLNEEIYDTGELM